MFADDRKECRRKERGDRGCASGDGHRPRANQDAAQDAARPAQPERKADGSSDANPPSRERAARSRFRYSDWASI